MSKPRPKFMDALEALDDGEDDEGSSEPSSSSGGGDGDDGGVKQADGAPQSAAPPPAKRAKASTITLEDLQAQGYSGGPSVLAMRPPTEDAAPANWTWSDGRDRKAAEPEEESAEERRRTHAAATTAAEESAAYAMLAAARAAELREAARKEKEERAKKGQLSFNQKEKRKRDAGMQSRGRSTVEEEKRVARQYGVYSGFD